MEFDQHKPIYLQIADAICEKILTETWKEEERIPSVREYGVRMEVNPNTVARSYDELSSENIIYNKRGIGYFVSPGAKDVIRKRQRTQFMEESATEFFRKMDILGITMDEVRKMYENYQKIISHNNEI